MTVLASSAHPTKKFSNVFLKFLLAHSLSIPHIVLEKKKPFEDGVVVGVISSVLARRFEKLNDGKFSMILNDT